MNTGIFWYDPSAPGYRGGTKPLYQAFRMLSQLGGSMFTGVKTNDDYVTILATRDEKSLALIISNYIDSQSALNFISRTIATLKENERRELLNIIKADKLEVILGGEIDIAKLRVRKKVKALLKAAREVQLKAARRQEASQPLTLHIKNVKGDYLYRKYRLDASTGYDTGFVPVEEKELGAITEYREEMTLEPYSVTLIVLKEKMPEPHNLPTPDDQGLYLPKEVRLPLQKETRTGDESVNEQALPEEGPAEEQMPSVAEGQPAGQADAAAGDAHAKEKDTVEE
jgi:hypothetical protein